MPQLALSLLELSKATPDDPIKFLSDLLNSKASGPIFAPPPEPVPKPDDEDEDEADAVGCIDDPDGDGDGDGEAAGA